MDDKIEVILPEGEEYTIQDTFNTDDIYVLNEEGNVENVEEVDENGNEN